MTTGRLTNSSKDELDRLTEYSVKRAKIPENLKAGANGLAVGTYYSLKNLGPCVVAELSERTTSGVDVSQFGKSLYPDDPLRAEMFQRYFDFSKERGAEVAITISSIRTGGAPSGKGKPGVNGINGKADVQPKTTVEPKSANKPFEQKRDAGGKFLPKDGSELQPGSIHEKNVDTILRESSDAGTVSRQVRIMTQSGKTVVGDNVSMKSGRVKLTEAKGSETAHLNSNQRSGYAEIEQSGGTVVGSGTKEYPAGTKIPATRVRVVRPKHLERLNRMRGK